MKHGKWIMILACMALVGLLATTAGAATLTWDGDTGTVGLQEGSGTWNITDVNRWYNGATYQAWSNATPDGAIFGSVTTTSTTVYTVTLGVPITASSIFFKTSVGLYTIAGDATNRLTLADGATIIRAAASNNNNNQTISAPMTLSGTVTVENLATARGGNNVRAIVLSGTLTGTVGTKLVFDSTASGNQGEMIVNADNGATFLGAVELRNGFLSANSVNALGDPTRAVDIYGGVLKFGAAVPKPLNIHGAATLSVWGNVTIPGAISIDNGVALTTSTGGNTETFSGVISGGATAGLIIPGRTVTLSGSSANTLSGTTTVTGTHASAATLNLSKTGGVDAIAGNMYLFANASGTVSTIVQWNGNDEVNNSSVVTLDANRPLNKAILRLNGYSDTIAGLNSVNVVANGVVQNQLASTNGVLGLGGSGTYSFGGTIQDGDAANMGTMTVTKSGTGTQTLSGTNTYSGWTTVDGGRLILNGLKTGAGTAGNAAITVASGTLTGSATIKFKDGDLITVGSAGTFDASAGMKWDLMSLTGDSPLTLLDYTAGGATFTAPGTLNSLLAANSVSSWTLSDVGNRILANALLASAWNVDGDGNWSDPNNWVAPLPNAAGVTANFLTLISAPHTVTVDVPVTVGGIMFKNANAYTIVSSDANTNTITLDSNSPGSNTTITAVTGSHEIAAPVALNQSLEVTVTASDRTLTISGNMSGASANLTKAGGGTLLLSGTNTFVGNVTVISGTLQLSGGNAIPDAASVTVNGALDMNGSDETMASVNSTAGAIHMNGGTLRVNGATANSTLNSLDGSGAVYKTGTGTVTLTNNASYSGTFDFTGGAISTTGSGANAFGDTTGDTTLNGVLWNGVDPTAAGTENFHITGDNSTTQFNANSSNRTISGDVTIDPNAIFYWYTGGGNTGGLYGAIKGSGAMKIMGGGPGGSHEFSATTLGNGAGAANTFSGTTTLVQGTLDLNKPGGTDAIAGPLFVGTTTTAHVRWAQDNQINDASVVTIINGDLRLQGYSDTIGGLVSAVATTTVMNNHASNVSTLGINVADPNAAYTFSGAIIDGSTARLNLVKSGPGTQVLAGANTYTGVTTVTGGMLTINGSLRASIAVSSGTLNGNATLTFNLDPITGVIDEILVGATGAVDANSGMLWDVTSLLGRTTVLDYTSGGTFTAPGTLDSLLTTASYDAGWRLSDANGLVKALPPPGNAWNVDNNGNWSDPNNWSIGVPNAPGDLGAFLEAIASPRTVTVDTPATVGTIRFDNS